MQHTIEIVATLRIVNLNHRSFFSGSYSKDACRVPTWAIRDCFEMLCWPKAVADRNQRGAVMVWHTMMDTGDIVLIVPETTP